MLANEYLDKSVQKGGIPGVSGCKEHTAVLTQLIREAKEDKGNVSVLWLDLTNACGSLTHKVIQEMLRSYHVPVKLQSVIADYYTDFHTQAVALNGRGWRRA